MRHIQVLTYAIASLATVFATSCFAQSESLAGNQYQPLTKFGHNPGDLTASYYQPSSSAKNVVVLLHGCVQDAKQLAENSGFKGLAATHNFTLLLPQQSEKNNIKQCFNWFSPQDTARDKGETLSLKNMMMTLKKQIGANKIYVAGLSAGGAMTSSLLINYPQLFSGGAVIAGLPYPCADNLIKAISCMRTGPSQSVAELAQLANENTPNSVNWPPLYVMAGSADTVVNPINSTKLAQQWALLVNQSPQKIVKHSGYHSKYWTDKHDNSSIKLVSVNDMGHGISVNPSMVNGGKESLFIPKATISGAKDIIEFWQLSKKL